MAQIPISISDFNLLKKEIETLGELLSAEQVNRQAEVDKLKLEIEVLKQVLDSMLPKFFEQYSNKYQESVQAFDPEWRKQHAA